MNSFIVLKQSKKTRFGATIPNTENKPKKYFYNTL